MRARITLQCAKDGGQLRPDNGKALSEPRQGVVNDFPPVTVSLAGPKRREESPAAAIGFHGLFSASTAR
jgi:hypothetical protein